MRHLFCLTILISTLSFPQNSYEIEIEEYLNANGTLTYYSNVIDRMYDFIQQEFNQQEIPDSVWTDLRNDKDEALNSIKSQIVGAYQAHFSREEIQEMKKFYTSGTGMKVLQNKPLNSEEVTERDGFYDSSTGKKIQESTESLNTILRDLTENWSTNLYASAKNKLRELGYVKKQ